MRRRTIAIVVTGMAVVLVAAGTISWYVYDQTRPLTAAAAGERLRADIDTFVSELGLRDVSTDVMSDLGGGQDCGIWTGGGEQLNDEPRQQHRVALDALAPAGRAATELAEDAEAILRRLGYRVITDEINFDTPPPPGTVISTGGRHDVLRIELWPEPEQDTVGVTGSSDCLPV